MQPHYHNENIYITGLIREIKKKNKQTATKKWENNKSATNAV